MALVVDEVGLGGPVMDRLQQAGVPVFGFHSGKPARDSIYTSRRSEMCWAGALAERRQVSASMGASSTTREKRSR